FQCPATDWGTVAGGQNGADRSTPPLRLISPRARSKAAMSAHAKLRSSKESPNGGNHSYCARVDPKQEAVRWRHRAVQPCTNKSTSVRPLRANHAALRG